MLVAKPAIAMPLPSCVPSPHFLYEIADKTISIRRLGSNSQEILPFKEAIAQIKNVAYMP